jgi:CRP-like cAMP-binding protein
MSIVRLDGGLTQPVMRRLNALRQLSEGAAAVFDKAIRRRVLHAAAGETLISEGERADRIRIILAGWLSRYKLLEDGRRQIVNFVLPGEICDAFSDLLSRSDHSIDTLTPVAFSEIDREQFEELIAGDRTLMEALLCLSLVEGSIQREWAVNIGRRDALERVAHLLCEIFERLRLVGLVEGNSCVFPVTQMDLADASGLSIVHLNRTLQELRATGLIILRERVLTINDLDALKGAGLFNPTYLPYLR